MLLSEIFASIAQTKIVFPAALITLSKAMAIIGALGLLLMSGRSSKNPALRLALGAYDIYNITGWLSDVLSYSRLLALGLATGVIASVVNQMGSMLGKSVFGVILFIVVFIVGHAMNWQSICLVHMSTPTDFNLWNSLENSTKAVENLSNRFMRRQNM